MKIYTTGEVSRICKVATTTVNKWFDTGRLKGFRVPGSRHRRIPRENLIAFLRDHGMPMDSLEDESRLQLLIVSRDAALVADLKSELEKSGQVNVTVTGSAFDAGIQAESVPPECVLVDLDVGSVDALRVCENFHTKQHLASAVVIALLSQHCPGCFDKTSVDDVFEKPFDPALVAERARTLSRTKMRGRRR